MKKIVGLLFVFFAHLAMAQTPASCSVKIYQYYIAPLAYYDNVENFLHHKDNYALGDNFVKSSVIFNLQKYTLVGPPQPYHLFVMDDIAFTEESTMSGTKEVCRQKGETALARYRDNQKDSRDFLYYGVTTYKIPGHPAIVKPIYARPEYEGLSSTVLVRDSGRDFYTVAEPSKGLHVCMARFQWGDLVTTKATIETSALDCEAMAKTFGIEKFNRVARDEYFAREDLGLEKTSLENYMLSIEFYDYTEESYLTSIVKTALNTPVMKKIINGSHYKNQKILEWYETSKGDQDVRWANKED